MTRSRLAACLTAAIAAPACGGRDAATPRRDVEAATPAAPHAAPHDEADLHVGTDTRRDLRITTALVSQETGVEQVLEMPGEIQVDENAYAEVGSPVDGRLARVLAQPGQRVAAGDALAEVRSPEIGRARADHAAAVARRTLARQSVARVTALVAERIAPQRELQEAEAALGAADADVASASTLLRAVGVDPAAPVDGDVASIVLRAPIAGTVLDRDAVLGQSVDPARTLFRLADLGRVWLVARAFERDAGRIRTGSVVRALIPALPGDVRTGRVAWTGKRVSPDSRTLPIRIELANPDGALKPGMTATALVPLAQTSGTALTVPAGALQRLADAWVAFVPRDDDQWHFEVRTVGRGRDLGPAVEIVSGLSAGERVVVDGAFVLKAEAEKARGGARAAHTH
jgi:cobalt-zinc-cadmium efflux system membrane fusion protein